MCFHVTEAGQACFVVSCNAELSVEVCQDMTTSTTVPLQLYKSHDMQRVDLLLFATALFCVILGRNN